MRNVVLLMFTSLDGVAEEPSDWFFDDGPELFELIAEVVETQTDVLLGRGTYDYWVDYWPTSDVEPFASFINKTRKHVATSTELAGAWENTTRISGPAEDYVRQLRARGLSDSYELLTDREREILQLLAEGRSNKEVAALLDVGLSTVETHRANLMQKLNLHNTAEIVLYAVRKGIIAHS